MGLVKAITRRVDVPHEPGQWVEFRMPSWLRLEEARRKKLAALAEAAKLLTGLTDIARANQNGREAPPEDPLVAYDLHTLLRGGIVAWSYETPFSPDLVDELDERTAQWAGRELLRMATPGEADLKDSASPSTAT